MDVILKKIIHRDQTCIGVYFPFDKTLQELCKKQMQNGVNPSIVGISNTTK